MTKLHEVQVPARQRAPLTIEKLSEESSVASGVESRELEIPVFGAIAGDERRYSTKKEGQ